MYLGGFQLALDLVEIARTVECGHAGVVCHGRAWREEPAIGAPQRFVLAGNGKHVVGLLDRTEDCAPHSGIVERRLGGVGPQHAERGDGGAHCDYDIVPFAQKRQRVGGRLVPPVHLTRLQRGHGSRRVGNGVPLDAIEMRDLGAGEEAWFAGRAGHIVGELLVHVQRAQDPLGGYIAIRAATDDFRHALGRLGLRQMLGHDDREEGADLAERIWDHREWLFQTELDDLVRGCRQFIGDSEQRLAKCIALRPALQARHCVTRAHRLAVVEFQSITQREFPGLAIVLDDVTLDHLWLCFVVLVQAIERVEYQAAVHDR